MTSSCRPGFAVGEVIAGLSADHQCIAPTLPMGAHRHAMHADADLSSRGLARLVSELLDRLELNDVTLVGKMRFRALSGSPSPSAG